MPTKDVFVLDDALPLFLTDERDQQVLTDDLTNRVSGKLGTDLLFGRDSSRGLFWLQRQQRSSSRFYHREIRWRSLQMSQLRRIKTRRFSPAPISQPRQFNP